MPIFKNEDNGTCTMLYLSAYLRESLDFFKIGILQKMNNIRACAREVISVR